MRVYLCGEVLFPRIKKDVKCEIYGIWLQTKIVYMSDRVCWRCYSTQHTENIDVFCVSYRFFSLVEELNKAFTDLKIRNFD